MAGGRFRVARPAWRIALPASQRFGCSKVAHATHGSAAATTVGRLKRIGHKGADSIRPGNTLESFEAAVAAGVEMIELDVLRPRSEFLGRGIGGGRSAGPVAGGAPPLLVAHDWGDAARREPLTLDEVLDAFTRAPLDRVEIDCDLKIAGREDEVVAALGERGLLERASVSTMEVSSLRVLRELDPGLRLGWTVPRVTRDWNSIAVGQAAGGRGARLAAKAAAGKRPSPGAGAGGGLDLGL